MSTLLKTTQLGSFAHHLCDGEQVVRNPKINALMQSKLAGIDPSNYHILATPVFTGSPNQESIMWQTDVFGSAPQPLSALQGEEHEHYRALLQQAMQQYADAVEKAPEPTRQLLQQAITFHSEDNVFCGDNRVVLTEWGMHPRESRNWNSLLSMSFAETQQPKPVQPTPEPQPEEPANPITAEPQATGIVGTPANDKPAERIEDPAKDPVEKREDTPVKPSEPAAEGPAADPTVVQGETADGKKNGGKKKGCLKWLLWLLLALLILILIGACVRKCGDDGLGSVPVVLPPVSDEDVSLSDDSLTYEVNNRLILLISDGGTVAEFIREFRQAYPDEGRYVLANPDTLLPRVVLKLPKEEKADFIEALPQKFPKWDLTVIPETLFGTSVVSTNDPALKDNTKRWYFDLCGIENAWATTMGDPNIVVAVIDDGFDLSHPELQGKVVDTFNAVDHTSNVSPSSDGHGMHVACTAVGKADNGEGTAGIAPHCSLMAIQVADEKGRMSSSAVLDAVLYAIMQNADVVNMSLGMMFNPLIQFLPDPIQRNMIANNFLEEERVWKKIFDMAEAHGVTFVMAGGNQNIMIGLDPMERSNKTIKVAAVEPDKSKASFSNYGEYCTLSAPGVKIYNAVPGNKYEFMDGTSMASPIVTGAVALLKSADKTLTTRQIIDILQRTGLTPKSTKISPIVHFGDNGVVTDPGTVVPPTDGGTTDPVEDDCTKYQRRYNELLEELERLKHEHPDCVAAPDTMKIPEDATVADINGLWMSTTRLYNTDNEEVVLYFEFNGSPRGKIHFVEPDGSRYTAPLSVTVGGDKVYMEQLAVATGTAPGGYNEYTFVCRPDRSRTAVCQGQNISTPSNKVNFNLIRLNH